MSLNNSKSTEVSTILQSILANLNNSVSLDGHNSSTDFQFLQSRFQGFGDCSMCTIYNWYQRLSHVRQVFRLFGQIQGSFRFFLFSLSGQLEQKNPSDNMFFFLEKRTRYLVFWPGLGDSFISQNPREFVSFSETYSDLYIYYLIAWSNFNLWHNSQWITFSTQLYLVLYSFCASLRHLFNMWFTSLSTYPTLAILLHMINFHFRIIGHYYYWLLSLFLELRVSEHKQSTMDKVKFHKLKCCNS